MNKLISAGMAVLFCLTLQGCGKEDSLDLDNLTSTSGTSGTPSTSPTSASTPSTTSTSSTSTTTATASPSPSPSPTPKFIVTVCTVKDVIDSAIPRINLRMTARDPYGGGYTGKKRTCEILRNSDDTVIAIEEATTSLDYCRVNYNIDGHSLNQYAWWKMYYTSTSQYAKYQNSNLTSDYTVVFSSSNCTQTNIFE